MTFKRDIAEIQEVLVEGGQIPDSELDVESEVGAIVLGLCPCITFNGF